MKITNILMTAYARPNLSNEAHSQLFGMESTKRTSPRKRKRADFMDNECKDLEFKRKKSRRYPPAIDDLIAEYYNSPTSSIPDKFNRTVRKKGDKGAKIDVTVRHLYAANRNENHTLFKENYGKR